MNSVGQDGPSAFGARRIPLPDRRPSETIVFAWAGREWTITVGFDDSHYVREIFADGAKIGSEREAELDDACILISMLLQSGWLIQDLLAKLSRQGIDPEAPAASVFGLMCKIAAEAETRRQKLVAEIRARTPLMTVQA